MGIFNVFSEFEASASTVQHQEEYGRAHIDDHPSCLCKRCKEYGHMPCVTKREECFKFYIGIAMPHMA